MGDAIVVFSGPPPPMSSWSSVGLAPARPSHDGCSSSKSQSSPDCHQCAAVGWMRCRSTSVAVTSHVTRACSAGPVAGGGGGGGGGGPASGIGGGGGAPESEGTGGS